jgi:hypothetical protein
MSELRHDSTGCVEDIDEYWILVDAVVDIANGTFYEKECARRLLPAFFITAVFR